MGAKEPPAPGQRPPARARPTLPCRPRENTFFMSAVLAVRGTFESEILQRQGNTHTHTHTHVHSPSAPTT